MFLGWYFSVFFLPSRGLQLLVLDFGVQPKADAEATNISDTSWRAPPQVALVLRGIIPLGT